MPSLENTVTLLRLLASALVITCTLPALAETFDFSFSGSSIYPYSPGSVHAPGHGVQDQGAGQFTATLTGLPGEYAITGVTGETNGSAIKGLLGVGDFTGNDNLLLFGDGAAAPLSQSGVSYLLANGQLVNLYFSSDFEDGSLETSPQIVMETPPNSPGALFLQTLTITPAMAQGTGTGDDVAGRARVNGRGRGSSSPVLLTGWFGWGSLPVPEVLNSSCRLS